LVLIGRKPVARVHKIDKIWPWATGKTKAPLGKTDNPSTDNIGKKGHLKLGKCQVDIPVKYWRLANMQHPKWPSCTNIFFKNLLSDI
jgi:hypothetical protein